MRRLRLWVATVTSVAVMALVAGCGGDNPAPSAAPSDEPPPSDTHTASAPIAPNTLNRKTRRGAVDAVRHFLSTMDFAGESGNVDQFRATFARSCTKCEAIARGIEETYAAGGSIVGGAWKPRRFRFYGTQGDVATIDVVVDYDAQTFVARQGETPDEVAPQVGVLKAFQVVWNGDSTWLVGALDPSA